MELIEKEAVLAVIEKLKDEALEYGDKARWLGIAALAKEINSIKITEVNLDKPFEGVKVQTSMKSGSLDEVIITTKYKAKKGE